jgi:hypothetical protein
MDEDILAAVVGLDETIALLPVEPTVPIATGKLLLGRIQQSEAANRFTIEFLPVLRAVQRGGATTLKEITEALNDCGARSSKGGSWHRSSVRNLLIRAKHIGR